jgi:hypothetical protein
MDIKPELGPREVFLRNNIKPSFSRTLFMSLGKMCIIYDNKTFRSRDRPDMIFLSSDIKLFPVQE